MKKGLLLVIILFTYSCINLLFSLDENPNRVRQNQKEYNPLLGSPYEKMFAYRQEEINKKTVSTNRKAENSMGVSYQSLVIDAVIFIFHAVKIF